MRDPRNILADLHYIHTFCKEGECPIKCSNMDDCKFDSKFHELCLAVDRMQELIPKYLWKEYFN